MMQRRFGACSPRGKTTREPNEDQRKRENLGVSLRRDTRSLGDVAHDKVVAMGMELMSVRAHKHILLAFVVSGCVFSFSFFFFPSTLGFVSNQLHNKSCNVRHACVIITGIITTMKPFILLALKGFRALVG